MRSFFTATAALLLCLAGVGAQERRVSAQGPEPLFVHGAPGAGSAPARRATGRDVVVERRLVGMRLDALFDATGSGGRRVLLNTGREVLTARFERLDRDGAGFRSWVGAIDGLPDSHVVFSERDGIVAGLITTPTVVYQLRTTQPGAYMLERVDPAAFPAGPDTVVRASGAAALAPPAPADDGRTIDVLLLYTPQARAALGGTVQTDALAAQIISDTNTIFARSGIVPRVRLAGRAEINFAESPQISADLSAFAASAQVRLLRDLAGADLVQLLVSSPDLHSCGTSYLLTSLAPGFDAFSVADVACTSQFTPTHELGHNMGAHHAPEDGAGVALFPYSYAYKDDARGFRTVMAYACASAACARLPNFSNPAVRYNGVPTGTPTQDNARTINEAAFTVANFRRSATRGGIAQAPLSGLRTVVSGHQVTVAWDPVGVHAGAATSYLLQVGTTPGASDIYDAVVSSTSAAGLLPPGRYVWRVYALTPAGFSAPSPEAEFAVATGCEPLSPPTALHAAVTDGVVVLSWSAPAGTPPIGYLLEVGSRPGHADLFAGPVGAVTALSARAAPGSYFVRVRALNSCGASDASNQATVVVR